MSALRPSWEFVRPYLDAWGWGLTRLTRIENGFLALVFAIAIALPLLEIVLRAARGSGIIGVNTYVQHLTLALGMFGAAVAARDERLLALAVTPMLVGKFTAAARLVSGASAAAISALMAMASIEFVSLEREAQATLVEGFPIWIAQLPLPIGFGLIGLRLVHHAADSPAGRATAASLAITIVLLLQYAMNNPGPMLTPSLVLICLILVLGAPIFAAIGGTAILLLASWGVPAASVAVNHYSLVSNPSLPAIPMFTLAGYLLAESQAPRRLTNLFYTLFGNLRGGASLVCVVSFTFFTCFTGASGVTILALGGLIMPLLMSFGYRETHAVGLVTSAGLPGVLLIPALPLILYAIVARVTLEEMFLGGVLPALLMMVIIAVWGILREPRARESAEPFQWTRARAALHAAKWELSLPFVPVILLLGGFATPIEAAATTALYAFIITAVIHKDLSIRGDIPRVAAECGLLVGGILLILGVALSLTNFLVDAEIPDSLVSWVSGSIEHRWIFLLSLNAVLLIAGCVMDIYTAIVVLVPLVVPLGRAFGVDPVHLGIIFLANLELGYLTPPVGMNLFFASYRFGKPLPEVFRSVIGPFLVLAIGVLIITYVPLMSTGLPSLIR